MIDKASEQQLGSALREYFSKRDAFVEPGTVPYTLMLSSADLQKIKLQFRALGLIKKDTSQKSLKDTSTYWTLTPYGDSEMTKANAVRSGRRAPTPVSPSATDLAHSDSSSE